MSPPLRTILLVTLPLVLAVTIGTLMPGRLAAAAPGNDKVQHLLAFGALTLPTALIRPRWALPAVLLVVAYGGFIEVIQPRFGRTADLADWAADFGGALAGAALGVALHHLRRLVVPAR